MPDSLGAVVLPVVGAKTLEALDDPPEISLSALNGVTGCGGTSAGRMGAAVGTIGAGVGMGVISFSSCCWTSAGEMERTFVKMGVGERAGTVEAGELASIKRGEESF